MLGTRLGKSGGDVSKGDNAPEGFVEPLQCITPLWCITQCGLHQPHPVVMPLQGPIQLFGFVCKPLWELFLFEKWYIKTHHNICRSLFWMQHSDALKSMLTLWVLLISTLSDEGYCLG